VSFTYDNDGLLTGAGAMTISRDPTTGFVTGSTLGSINESHTYTAFGEEKTYTVSSGGTTLYSVDYGTRDQLGSIVTKTETVLGETHTFVYGYDSRNRLSDVTKDGVPIAHYDYDANGNRLTAPGLTASPVYDAQDRLTAYGACTYSYKPDGSLQTKTCPDGTTTYDYDSFGNLRNVVLPDGTHIEYLIDGQNRRVGKKVCGTTINVSCPVASLVEGFVYRSQFQPSAWLNGDGSVRATFVYGLKINVPEYMVHGSATYRLVTDHIGSVRLVIDMATGAVVERIDSDEFGNVLTDSAPGTQPFGFAGGLYDRDDALVRLGARDYGPSIGRWTSKDPILFNGGSASVYVYVRNDPLNFSDPTGLCFGETFNATFAFNLNTMNHLAFSFPTGVTRFGLGFLTAGATARTFGTVTLGQAIRSVFSPGLGPPGIATLGRIEGTIGSLALNTTLNSIAVAGALEIGFVIGSAADALGQALADGEPCRNGCK
jgi:RHS repeat-associated protein